MTAVQQAAPIELTQAAEEKIRDLLEDEGDDELCLRVFVTGGGCSGFQYGFTFDDEQAEDDARIVPAGNQDQPEYSEDGENAEYLDVMRRPVSAE